MRKERWTHRPQTDSLPCLSGLALDILWGTAFCNPELYLHPGQLNKWKATEFLADVFERRRRLRKGAQTLDQREDGRKRNNLCPNTSGGGRYPNCYVKWG